MPLTVPQQISIGALCSVYTSNELSSGKRHGGVLDVGLPVQIYAVNQGLKWLYEYDPTNSDLVIIGNHLISICRQQFRAQAVLSLNNGGTIAPIVPNATPPSALDFIVSATSFIPTGGRTVYIPQFIGYSVNLSRGNTIQHTTPPENYGTYYRWNIVTGYLELFNSDPLDLTNGAATLGEPFRIMPDTGGDAEAMSQVYPFIITGTDFEPDGITYNNPSIVGDQLMMFITGYNQEWQFETTFFSYTPTGFVITSSGFDANNFGNIIIQKIN
jgi:hypothetical protein